MMELSKQEAPPPPYSAVVFGDVNNFGTRPVNYAAATSSAPASVTTLDHLSQVLSDHEQLNFYPTSRIGLGNSTFIVQLQDTNGQPVITTLYTPGQHVSQDIDNDHTSRIGGTTKFMDPTGKTLLIGQKNGHSLTVTSGDMVLGVVKGIGIFGGHFEDIVAKNVLGQVVFRVIGGHNKFKFFSGNGTKIGQIAPSLQDGMAILSFSQGLDSQTKGLMLATAHTIYRHNYAMTTTESMQIGLCLCVFIVIVLLLIFGFYYFW